MIETIITIIGSFITGGGLSTFFTLRYVKRSQKLDFADRAIKFMEGQNENLMKDVIALQAEVKQLQKFRCERMDCTKRII